MKQFLTAILTCVFSASIAATALPAMMQTGFSASRIRPWLGTWSCRMAGNNHTATFTPVWGGNAMHISETGKVPSEETIFFDTKRGKWLDQYADASGAYATMEGTPSGNNIRFRQIYPAGNPTLLVTMASKNMYTTSYTMTANGKTMTQRETCTRM
jgi:hypothetical protein